MVGLNQTLLTKISVSQAVTYLERNGWERVKSKNKNLLTFSGPNDDRGNPLTIVFPTSDDVLDWIERLSGIVELLSVTTHRKPEDVVADMVAQDLDIFRVRVMQKKDSVPLNVASTIIEQLTELVSCAATVEAVPRPHFVKLSAIGITHAGYCRFGQTFSGSMGFTVESPVDVGQLTLPVLPLEKAIPFSRRVVERITRGLAQADLARAQQDPGPIIANYATGLNANMCDAIVEMVSVADAEGFEFRTSWASDLAPSDSVASVGAIKVSHSTVRYLSMAATALRPALRPELVRITGSITQLRLQESEDREVQKDPEDSHQDRVVTLSGYFAREDRIINIRVFLQADDYHLACDAHRDGQIVTVVGVMEKRGRFWVIMMPTRFEVHVDE